MTESVETEKAQPKSMAEIVLEHFPHAYAAQYGDGPKIMCSCDQNFPNKQDWSNHVMGAWVDHHTAVIMAEPDDGEDEKLFNELGMFYGELLSIHADLREEYVSGNTEPHMKTTNQIIQAEANGMRMAGRYLLDSQDHPPRYIPDRTVERYNVEREQIVGKFMNVFL